VKQTSLSLLILRGVAACVSEEPPTSTVSGEISTSQRGGIDERVLGAHVSPTTMGNRVMWTAVAVMVAAAGCASEAELLTRRDAEPPGANCKNGGTALRAGTDDDGDGVLDDAEVDHVEYVCDEPPVQIRKDLLAPSLECPAGGIAVQTGLDDDGDGVLDDAEIDRTMRVCNSIELWEGDFHSWDWNDPLKVAALRGARIVAGSLEIAAADAMLPLLEQVTGDLSIGDSRPDTPAEQVALPALRWVGGRLAVTESAEALALPALTEVGGSLSVRTGAAGRALPALTEVGGGLGVVTAAGAVSFGAPLRVAGGMGITAGTGAVAFAASLQVGGGLFIDGDLAQLAAPGLSSIGGVLQTWYGSQGVLSPQAEIYAFQARVHHR
jgi:hypothetical protein